MFISLIILSRSKFFACGPLFQRMLRCSSVGSGEIYRPSCNDLLHCFHLSQTTKIWLTSSAASGQYGHQCHFELLDLIALILFQCQEVKHIIFLTSRRFCRYSSLAQIYTFLFIATLLTLFE